MTTTTLLQGTTDAELGLGQVAGGAPAQFEIDGDGTAHFALGTTMDQVFETMGEDPFDLGGTEELGYTATPRNVPTVLVAVSADDITREELEAILPDEMLGDRVFDDAWLGGLEREMSAHGAAIAAARVETLHRLQEAIDTRPDGAFPKAILALEGLLEARFENGSKSADVEEDFAELLRDVRGRDAGAGRALDGPHRSDLKARHAAKNMDADQCSTGEQKALLVGLTLAQARALAGDPGAGPSLILIDEAAAHLDSIRRAALFDELLANEGQAWLTGTDENLFEAFGPRAQMFEVRDGQVSAG